MVLWIRACCCIHRYSQVCLLNLLCEIYAFVLVLTPSRLKSNGTLFNFHDARSYAISCNAKCMWMFLNLMPLLPWQCTIYSDKMENIAACLYFANVRILNFCPDEMHVAPYLLRGKWNHPSLSQIDNNKSNIQPYKTKRIAFEWMGHSTQNDKYLITYTHTLAWRSALIIFLEHWYKHEKFMRFIKDHARFLHWYQSWWRSVIRRYILNNIQDQRSYPEKSLISAHITFSAPIYQLRTFSGTFTRNQFSYSNEKKKNKNGKNKRTSKKQFRIKAEKNGKTKWRTLIWQICQTNSILVQRRTGTM